MSSPRLRLRAWLASHDVASSERIAALPEGPEVDALTERLLDARDRLRASGRATFLPGGGDPVRLELEGVRLLVEPRVSPQHRAWTVVADGDALHLRAEPARSACGVRAREQEAREALVRRGLPARRADRVLRALRRPGLGDRWIDQELADAFPAAIDAAIADAVRADRDPRPMLEAGEALSALVRHATHEAARRWSIPPRALPVRALMPRHRLPPGLAARLDGSEARIDTDDLPEDLAAEVLAHATDPEILVLLGDNRAALRGLRASGVAVDAVLEDSPYDTGSALLPYRDAWPEGAWTAMMREHLDLVRASLSRRGQVVLHADENRGADLHQLFVSCFGDGALGAVIWDKRNPKGDARGIASRHERIEWAVRDLDHLHARGGLRRPKANARRMLQAAAEMVRQHDGLDAARAAWSRWVRQAEGLSGGERAYRHLDDDGRVCRRVSMAWPNRKTPPDSYFQPLSHPDTGLPCPVPARGWRNPPHTMARLLSEGRIAFGADHTTQPTRLYWLDELPDERMPSVVAWAGSDDALLASMGLSFAFGKPVGLLQRLLATAAPDADALVFDGFGGSGSTAHAVLLANEADGGRRRCVLVERDASIVRSILLPRLQRVLASTQWEEGRPVGPPRDAVVRVDALLPPRP